DGAPGPDCPRPPQFSLIDRNAALDGSVTQPRPSGYASSLSRTAGLQLACSPSRAQPGIGLDVAAFPGSRLRHLQKLASVEEELKRSGIQVQVEFTLTERKRR